MHRRPRRSSQVALASAIILLGAVSVASFYVTDPVTLFALVELASVATFFIFFVSVLPVAFPSKVRLEDVFTGGAAKPPYLSDEEIYAPQHPLRREGGER